MRLLLAALLLVSFSTSAVQLTPRQCHALAAFVVEVAQARDSGSVKESHWRNVEENNASVPPEELAMLRRAFDAVYASKLSPRVMAEETMARCYQLKGNMGEDT